MPLVTVCRVLQAPRSTIHHRRARGNVLGCRPGPATDIGDDDLVAELRICLSHVFWNIYIDSRVTCDAGRRKPPHVIAEIPQLTTRVVGRV